MTNYIAGNFLAFATIDTAQDGLQTLPQKLRLAIGDTRMFLNNTGREANNLLVTNFGELEEHLDSVLDDSGTVLTESLGEANFPGDIDISTRGVTILLFTGSESEFRITERLKI